MTLTIATPTNASEAARVPVVFIRRLADGTEHADASGALDLCRALAEVYPGAPFADIEAIAEEMIDTARADAVATGDRLGFAIDHGVSLTVVERRH